MDEIDVDEIDVDEIDVDEIDVPIEIECSMFATGRPNEL